LPIYPEMLNNKNKKKIINNETFAIT